MAGRPRLPQEVARITGAMAKNPQMFRGRANPKVKSLGPAPKRMTEVQREIWDEVNADFPWLGRSDRRQVEGLVYLLEAQQTLQGEAPMSLFAEIRLTMSKLGGNPSDRTKIAAPDEDAADPADEFVN